MKKFFLYFCPSAMVLGVLMVVHQGAFVLKPKFKTGMCVISNTDTQYVDPWQKAYEVVYKIIEIGKVSYRVETKMGNHAVSVADWITFDQQSEYTKVKCTF